MADINNEHTVTGTLYSKITRTAEGKKPANMGKIYEFYYYIIEAPTRKTWTADGKEKVVEKKELIKFSLPMGMSPDDFDVTDHVEIRFSITGREWTNKQGEKDVINENKISHIKFADIKTDEGNVVRNPKKDDVFVPPTYKDEPEEESDLPFVWTILIGMGMLLPQAMGMIAT